MRIVSGSKHYHTAMKPFLDENKAALALLLWHDHQWDTFDIATALEVHESVVCRCIQASRDVQRT